MWHRQLALCSARLLHANGRPFVRIRTIDCESKWRRVFMLHKKCRNRLWLMMPIDACAMVQANFAGLA